MASKVNLNNKEKKKMMTMTTTTTRVMTTARRKRMKRMTVSKAKALVKRLSDNNSHRTTNTVS
jgi:hypothetical protein